MAAATSLYKVLGLPERPDPCTVDIFSLDTWGPTSYKNTLYYCIRRQSSSAFSVYF